MATLKTYLDQAPRGAKRDLAQAVGISPAMLSQYLSGLRRPEFDRMVDIEKATGGAVTVDSWKLPQGSDRDPVEARP